jgi:serine/threonine protein kinase
MSFEQCALASGLLTQSQLDAARAGIRWSDGDELEQNTPPSDTQIADRLVETGALNAWQAKQLLDGRTKFNLGPYFIVDSIGQGGMGQVFKAKHEKLGIVAVKVLPRDKSTPDAIASFTREIRALESLDHPRLVSALDAGIDGNVHYLVTEYVPGLDLRKLVRRDGPLDMVEAASIICQVAEGLEYAHSKGIVHRDVKPGNVLVSPAGEAKLSDLGLAGPLEGQGEADPRYGKIVGTADYLSPDHVLDPWSPTPAWDVYSLGCTLYYTVTGKVPFPGGTTADKAKAHCELRPLDPRRLNPSLDPDFVEIMADMMAKDPTRRIGSAREVITRLTSFLQKVREADENLTLKNPEEMIAIPMAAALPPPLRAHQSIPVMPLADTLADLPPAAATGAATNAVPADGVQSTFSNCQPQGETPQVPLSFSHDLMAVIWPLTVFVLAPSTLVGAILLLWFLMQRAL